MQDSIESNNANLHKKQKNFKRDGRDSNRDSNNRESNRENHHRDSNHAQNRESKFKDSKKQKNFHTRDNKEQRESKHEKHERDSKHIDSKHERHDKKDFKPKKWVGENKHAAKNKTKEQERHEDGTRKVLHADERNNVGFHKDLKKGVESNNKIQKGSLNPHHKLNLDSNAKVRITPLGGLGEIGGNMTVIETQNSAIIIDIGMSFPDDSMPGVDILVPDFSYIESIKNKIDAIIITHAHEDHIGAVPYFFKQYQFPLYGTPLALGLVGNKFDEHGLKKYKELFHIVEKRTPVKIGDFEIEWIHITHSIIDSSALAIRTEAGVIIHTGDFKIDHTPIDNLPTDLHRLAHYGEEGVMLLLSDSTNSHKSGVTPSEASVGPTFDKLFKDAKGRVIMSTFSSNIHRVYQAIKYGLQYNRKIAVIGRSMEKNLEIARELGYIDLPSNIFIEAHEVMQYPDEEVLIVTTGSQGETMSALYRMAADEHRHIKLKPTDIVILSAKAIPGNEASVSAVINLITKQGAKVAYQDFSEIHVSGHAAQEEQKLMLRLIKPKFFLPVHGEYNHISRHKQTAISCGVPEKNIYLMEDGDQIEVNPNYMRKVKSVKTGKTFVDNQVNRILHDEIINERNLLANDGIFILTLHLSKSSRAILESRINVFGIAGPHEEKELNKIVNDELRAFLANAKDNIFVDSKTLEGNLFNFLRKLLFKQYKKYPAILVNVLFDGVSPKPPHKDSKPNFIESKNTDSIKVTESAMSES
ncbi:RNase J family beta-CASP ribonuclease [Helicobacter saguini]|uniref:Ribonuclease J n=2 Tax=Helicobacter saguini TaxID=1548018 RepID=A0A347VTZ7_9HELI|nr:RNase J family beta-CASP ribonuclease [Helicobacter saguini]MWV68114.1 RNase J family beta-CASP ribonuclease [Helicobacter saguini]MWV70422.1 RNase J family beta-CASP ribonuclease [Helicobacter saguini]MWV72323.1 RNase J family beta-CASP ribonuclease [Helicobacter saguini]TLD93014.1 RNase J family beta-CASP ribonuclease [Helicobacter saguini]